VGDIADWCNDQMQEAYPDWCPTGCYVSRGRTDNIVCEHCGATGLEWHDTGVRWRLLGADSKFHVCNTAASADEFEVVS
jgi:hypothetical protein